MLPLTPKQVRFLDAILPLFDGDIPPTYEEMARATGMAKSQVHYMLQRLRDRGRVTFEHGRARTLRITGGRLPNIDGLGRRELLELHGLIADRLARAPS